jgi:predicted Zn-dependent protease
VLAHEMGHLRGGHARERFDELDRDVARSEIEQTLQNRYARDDEIQADEHAVLLLARAGYDSRAVITMLQALAGTTDYDDEEDPDDVHPWWPERIARAQILVSASTGELGSERYRARVRSLIVGDDPRLIALVGNAVVFGRAHVAIDLPPHKGVHLRSSSIELTLLDGATADLGIMNVELVKLFAGDKSPSTESATETFIAGTEAVTLSVTRTKDAAVRARALKAALRAPRADELAQLVPVRVDLAAPRRLWSQ